MRGYRSRVSTGSAPPLAASTTSAPSVGSPTRLPSLTTASAHSASGSMYWSSGHVRLARRMADGAHRGVALAADGVAATHDGHLDRGHLVEGQRAGLVGVDGRCGAERLHRAEPLDDGAGAASVEVPAARMVVVTAGRPVGMAETANATAVRNSSWNGEAAVEADEHREQQRHARDDQDLVGEPVELLGQGRLLDDRRLEHARDVADLGGHPRRRRPAASPSHVSPGCS